MAGHTNRLVLGAGAACAAATVAVAAIPFLRFAYDNLSLHVALETSEALIGGLLAYLAIGRSRVTGQLGDAVLGGSLAVLAATNLLLAATPNIVEQERAVGFVTWAAAGLRLLGTTGVMLAAVAGYRRAVSRWSPRRGPALTIGAAALMLALALAADLLLGDPIDPGIEATATNRPTLVGHPVLLVMQVAGAGVYAVAAYGFSRWARRGDDLMRWFAVGCVIAAFSRVHFLLFASLYTSWVSTGDALRFASYLAFLRGAVHEIRTYWRAQGDLGASRERTRLARDLHDGLTQDLSFIRSQTVGRTALDAATVETVASAAGRALLESRRLIRVLDNAMPASVEDAVRAAAGVVVERAGAELVVATTGDTDRLHPAVLTAVTAIAREAAGNAVRHGGARKVIVGVDVGDGRGRLRVEDDGSGFDPDAPLAGFGLRSMRARAEEIGGALEIRSARGEGAVVELRW